MARRVHVLISGRVQGVSFRAYACAQARALDLCGWVRNLADGRVEMVAEGSEANIRALLDWCGKGPSHARVGEVAVEDENPTGEFTGFEVRRDV